MKSTGGARDLIRNVIQNALESYKVELELKWPDSCKHSYTFSLRSVWLVPKGLVIFSSVANFLAIILWKDSSLFSLRIFPNKKLYKKVDDNF